MATMVLKGGVVLKVKDIMTPDVIGVREFETVEVAARTLEHYNIGAMPVYGLGGLVSGMITDRDMVTRCIAANREPSKTTVAQIMTNRLTAVTPDTDVVAAAELMAKHQVRRLPVIEAGKLCGMISLKDLVVRTETAENATNALIKISENITK